MRIPSGKTDQAIYFVAVDSTDYVTRETGLTGFTVYRSRNAGTATTYTTPTVTELSSANMPGVYALLVDEDTTIASTSDSEEYAVHITQASMAPVTRTIELYRRDTTSGQTATVSSGIVSANATQVLGSTPSTSAAGVLKTELLSMYGTNVVTTQAGIMATVLDWGRTASPNSTVAFSSISFSSVSVAVAGVNVTSVAGSPVVTTEAGVIATTFDLSRTANRNSTVAFSSVTFSTVPVTVGGVNVTSVAGTAVVTSAAGVIATTWDLGRTANLTSTVALTGLSVNLATTVANVTGGVNMTSVVGTAAVTSAAGIQAVAWDLGRTANLTSTVALTGMSINLVTTVSLGVTASSVTDKSGYGVSSVNTGVNVTSVVGTAAVTTSAGILASVWDLNRTANLTSTVALTGMSINRVTTVGLPVSVSSVTDKSGYGVSSVNTGVNVSSIVGSAAVTTEAGVFATAWDLGRTLNLTSTVALTGLSISRVTTVGLPVSVSSVTDKSGYGVSSVNTGINVSSIVGTAAVTTQAGIFATVLDWGRTANPNSTVAFSSISFSSVSVSVAGVNVTSVAGSPVVTTEAGVIATTFDLGRTANQNSTVAFSSVSFSSVSVAVAGVNVTSVAGTPVVTTSPGILATVFDLGRTANQNSTVVFSSVSFSTVAVAVGGVNVTSVAGTAISPAVPGVFDTNIKYVTGIAVTGNGQDATPWGP